MRFLDKLIWKLTPRKTRMEKVARMIWESAERSIEFHSISNQELVRLLRESVLDDLELFKPVSDLMMEAFDRLDPDWTERSE